MQRTVFVIAICIIGTLNAAVNLTPKARQYVSAVTKTLTQDRTCKMIKILASQSDEALELIKSLKTVTPAGFRCFATHAKRLAPQFKDETQANEAVQKLMQSCYKYAAQIVTLQKVATEIATPMLSSIRNIYSELPEASKNTLKMMEELDAKNGLTKEQKAAKIKEITQSIRDYSDADCQQIAKVYPPVAEYILPTGSKHAELMQQLDIIDKHADGTITDEEKQKLAEQSIQYNEDFREHFIEHMEIARERIDGYTVKSEIDNDQDINTVCKNLGNMLVNQYRRYIHTPAFKKRMNLAIKQSNQMHQAAEA